MKNSPKRKPAVRYSRANIGARVPERILASSVGEETRRFLRLLGSYFHYTFVYLSYTCTARGRRPCTRACDYGIIYRVLITRHPAHHGSKISSLGPYLLPASFLTNFLKSIFYICKILREIPSKDLVVLRGGIRGSRA